MEISNLLDKEFKVMIMKTFNKLGRRMDEHSDNFNKKSKEELDRAEEYNK